MEDKENKPKLLSCMIKGPGPVYKLRTLVGYEDHCPSKQRHPAFSMRQRTEIHVPSVGPGPRYDVTKLTNYGVDSTPAYTITAREPFKSASNSCGSSFLVALQKNIYRILLVCTGLIRDLGPGPGAHSPELCLPMNHSLRPPAYSIKCRSKTKITDGGPGPNAYSLPTCIGPKIPDKTAKGAFSIGGYHKIRQEHIGPGPAAYTNIKSDLIKRSSPVFSLKWRHHVTEIDFSPGPRYYPQATGKRPPMYSFGIRHSECAGLPITGLDEDY